MSTVTIPDCPRCGRRGELAFLHKLPFGPHDGRYYYQCSKCNYQHKDYCATPEKACEQVKQDAIDMMRNVPKVAGEGHDYHSGWAFIDSLARLEAIYAVWPQSPGGIYTNRDGLHIGEYDRLKSVYGNQFYMKWDGGKFLYAKIPEKKTDKSKIDKVEGVITLHSQFIELFDIQDDNIYSYLIDVLGTPLHYRMNRDNIYTFWNQKKGVKNWVAIKADVVPVVVGKSHSLIEPSIRAYRGKMDGAINLGNWIYCAPRPSATGESKKEWEVTIYYEKIPCQLSKYECFLRGKESEILPEAIRSYKSSHNEDIKYFEIKPL